MSLAAFCGAGDWCSLRVAAVLFDVTDEDSLFPAIGMLVQQSAGGAASPIFRWPRLAALPRIYFPNLAP